MSISVQNNTSYPCAGKLNSLEHSATTNARPMFLKGVLQKMTDTKVRDLDIEHMELTRSDLTYDASSASEQVHLEGRAMDLTFQGTFTTKAGDSVSFDAALSSLKVSASYAAMNYQSQTAGTAPADQLNLAA